jgi:hypothetical protein
VLEHERELGPAGCRNSVGVPGRLMATGTPSVTNDGITLRASDCLPAARASSRAI